MTAKRRPAALLLLGPTGVGKTPLGDYLERHGLGGRACVHFDFGACLRAVGAGAAAAAALSPQQVGQVREALAAGRLLTDTEFPIAAALLEACVRGREPGASRLLVLNGLPRHVGQALALEPYAVVRWVLHLEAAPAVVAARIAADVGGDRAGRADDGAEAVAQRLARFRRRTLPLLEHYRAQGVGIQRLVVGAATGAAELARAVRVSA